jgi:DNA-binding transcriptional ArsR family regulator
MGSKPPRSGYEPTAEIGARALASGTRLRILKLCQERALTNNDIAQRLGANPATTLHHVRTLVSAGFLEPLPERRGRRGAREVPYAASGKCWTDAELDELWGLLRATLLNAAGRSTPTHCATCCCDQATRPEAGTAPARHPTNTLRSGSC